MREASPLPCYSKPLSRQELAGGRPSQDNVMVGEIEGRTEALQEVYSQDAVDSEFRWQLQERRHKTLHPEGSHFQALQLEGRYGHQLGRLGGG